jgi:PAS domain S-box-containing protein
MKSLGTRFLLPLGVIAVLFSTFVLFETYEVARDHADGLMDEQAALALQFNLAVRSYAGEKIRPIMESLVDKDEFMPETMSTSFISRSIFEKVQKAFPDCIIRFSSEYPRNPVNIASPDELRVIEYFRKNPKTSGWIEEIRIDGRRFKAHFTPRWLTQDCMRCHGDPKDAPAALLRRYGETAGFNRKVGDLAGLDTVAVPFEAMNAVLAKEVRRQSMILAAGLVLLFGLIFIAFRFVVTRRLEFMARHFNEIAAHAESQRMMPVEVGGNDEITVVGAAFNRLLDQLRNSHASLEQRVARRTEELHRANEQLQLELAERKRAEEAMRKRENETRRLVQENAILAEIGSTINSSLDIDEVYERFAEEVRKLIPFDRISINLVDLKENRTTIAYVNGGHVPGRTKGNAVSLEGSPSKVVIDSGKSMLVPTGELKDYEKRYPAFLPTLQAGYQSVMLVPLISKDEVIAILHFRSTKSDMYSEEELRLADRVGYEITSAIVNAQTFAEQKRTEKALQESEKRFKDLYDNAPSGYHEYDLEGRITQVNRTELDMLGYTQEEMLGQFVWKLSVEEEMARNDILAKLAGALLPTREIERTYRRKDGTPLPVLISNRPVRDDQGRITGIRSTIQDITERKSAERALREKDEFTSSLLENAPMPILVMNEDTSIRYVNPMLEKLTGYASQEIIGRKAPYPWWTGDPESANLGEFEEHLKKGASGFEKLFQNKNGEKFWVEITDTPLIGRDNRRAGLGIWMDITERRRAEEEREKLRTRLQRAEKMEAIGTLAGGVAHDLNNILSGIVSYPDLLLMQLPERSPFRRPVAVMQDSGKRAAAIVQDLLTLARRAVPTLEVVNLNEVISQYLKSPELEKLLSFHPEVHVETRFDEGLLNILGSPLHLSKTVMNLISNATEAMPSGGTVLVSTENRYVDSPVKGYDHVDEGDYVTLAVSDTGIGISEADRNRIFEPFYTKKVMGRSGTGLGMAVVWGAVKDHKGYIDVQSAEGKGTTFTLYFPVTMEERLKDKPSSSVEEYRGRGETILIVDDVEGQREIASALLSHLGYSVTTVSSGEEAVQYLRNTTADLVILDMVMDPGIDGLETYRRILEMHPRQKAIIASGFSETLRVKEAQRLGAGPYIRKPYTLGKLAEAVRRELDRGQAFH